MVFLVILVPKVNPAVQVVMEPRESLAMMAVSVHQVLQVQLAMLVQLVNKVDVVHLVLQEPLVGKV
jgi:hypothetical protein